MWLCAILSCVVVCARLSCVVVCARLSCVVLARTELCGCVSSKTELCGCVCKTELCGCACKTEVCGCVGLGFVFLCRTDICMSTLRLPYACTGSITRARAHAHYLPHTYAHLRIPICTEYNDHKRSNLYNNTIVLESFVRSNN